MTIDERVKDIMALKKDIGEFSMDLYYDDTAQEGKQYVAKLSSVVEKNLNFHARCKSFEEALDLVESYLRGYNCGLTMRKEYFGY